MALIAGCRPQLLLLACAVLPLLVVFLRRQDTGRIRTVLAAGLPFVCVAAGLMWYNAARFGSPFDFGAAYNLTGNDMVLRGTVPERLVDGLFLYLLQPPTITTSFPFLLPSDQTTTYLGLTMVEPLTGGVLVCQPFLWGTVFAFGTRKHEASRWATLIAGALLVAGLFICCFDIEAGGVFGRYTQDFDFIFALAAAIVILQRLDGEPPRSTGMTLLLVAVVASLLYLLLLFLFMHSAAGCYTAGGSWAYIGEYLRQTFQFWN